MYTPLLNKIYERLDNQQIYKIAFVGDSISSAEWVFPNWRSIFEYILKFELEKSFKRFGGDNWWLPEWNLKFYNYALDGASSKNMLESVTTAISEVKPNMFVVMGTANDSSLGISVSGQMANLKSIFDICKTQAIDCVYSTDPYSMSEQNNLAYKPYVEEVLKLASAYVDDGSFVLLNAYEYFTKLDRSKLYTLEFSSEEQLQYGLKVDPVHPNRLGNAYIAKLFLEGAFGFDVNPEIFMDDVIKGSVKYPRWR